LRKLRQLFFASFHHLPVIFHPNPMAKTVANPLAILPAKT
jgi:hypothetical protein